MIALQKPVRPATGGEPAGTPLFYIMEMVYMQKMLDFITVSYTHLEDGVKHIRIKSRPNKWHENDCPFCHKSCPAYDKHSSRPTTWRGLDWGGILVEVEYQTHRIIGLEHGGRGWRCRILRKALPSRFLLSAVCSSDWRVR